MSNLNYQSLPPLNILATDYPPRSPSRNSGMDRGKNYDFDQGFENDIRDGRAPLPQQPQQSFPSRRQSMIGQNGVPSPHSEQNNPVPMQDSIEITRLKGEYYQSLVEFYYPYALQGIHAPIQNSLQEKAKEEAFYWVQQAQASTPLPPPLPVLQQVHQPPPAASTTPTIPTFRPSLPPTPQKPFIPSPTILLRSTSVAVPSTSIPLPSIPGAVINRSNSAAAAFNPFVPISPVGSRNRVPLPIPPSRAGSLKSISSNSTGIETVSEETNQKMRNGIDGPDRRTIINVPNQVNFQVSPSATMPSFSFDDDDPSPNVPTFSFGNEPTKSYNRPHPRDDPSHPSHPLYQPKSVLEKKTNSNDPVDCAGCGILIIGRSWSAVGKSFHPDCFICEEVDCGVKLEFIQFGVRDGKGYCMVHFEELFSDECYQCQTPISDQAFINVEHEDLLPPTSRTYHSLHFFCSSCGEPFLDPTIENSITNDVQLREFSVVKGYPYCIPCDTKLYKPKCKKCGLGIGGMNVEMISALGGQYHSDCFGCTGCGKELAEGFLVKESEKGELAFCLSCYS